MRDKLWAAQELLARYKPTKKVSVSKKDVEFAVAVIISKKALWYQKKAARILLDYVFGKTEVDELIQDVAVVVDRNDRLVRKWRKSVVERDKICVKCGSEKGLQAHHISHWADDPVNRIDVDNGVTLCISCHAKEHPKIQNLILRHGVAT